MVTERARDEMSSDVPCWVNQDRLRTGNRTGQSPRDADGRRLKLISAIANTGSEPNLVGDLTYGSDPLSQTPKPSSLGRQIPHQLFGDL